MTSSGQSPPTVNDVSPTICDAARQCSAAKNTHNLLESKVSRNNYGNVTTLAAASVLDMDVSKHGNESELESLLYDAILNNNTESCSTFASTTALVPY